MDLMTNLNEQISLMKLSAAAKDSGRSKQTSSGSWARGTKMPQYDRGENMEQLSLFTICQFSQGPWPPWQRQDDRGGEGGGGEGGGALDGKVQVREDFGAYVELHLWEISCAGVSCFDFKSAYF